MSHEHQHGPIVPSRDRLTPAFRWSVGINVAYVVVEAIAGLMTGSLSLLADAAHNLLDVAGLLLAWGAVYLSRRARTKSYSYGLGRATMMAALANAAAILLGSGVVVWEAIHRFSSPVDLPGQTIMWVALVGIGVNAASAYLFRSHGGDLNARGAFLHLMADAAVSLAVVLGAIGIAKTGWTWIDPAIAIGVSIVIALSAWGLLAKATGAVMDRVPESINSQRVEEYLLRQDCVESVHDLHIWGLSTTRTALTAHLVTPAGHPGDAFLFGVADELRGQFGIDHATLQVELGELASCPLNGRPPAGA